MQADETEKVLETEHFKIISHDAGNPQKYKNLAENNYSSISRDLELRASQKIELIITNDKNEFKRYGGREDVAGIAYPQENRIVIIYNPASFNTVLRHEINHILFLGGLKSGINIPLWFSEGLAIYHSHPGEEVLSLSSIAFQVDKLHGGFNINEENISEEEIKQISARGYFRVKFIAIKYGDDILFNLARDLRKGDSIEESLVNRTGLNSSQIDNEWEDYFKEEQSTSKLYLLRYGGYILLGILALLAAVAFWIKKKIALKRMEEEELEHYEKF